MKIFIWQEVEHLTDNWHHEGGLVIIAESFERACSLAPNQCIPTESGPDFVADIVSDEEKVFIFPNAGCC